VIYQRIFQAKMHCDADKPLINHGCDNEIALAKLGNIFG
jgi:hypothetical protein